MNLRSVCSEYLNGNPHFTDGTIKKFRHSVNRWEKGTGSLSLDAGEQEFSVFRKSMLDKGLSPSSIEQTVYDIKVLLKSTGRDVITGKGLKRRRPCPVVPEVANIGKAFAMPEIANWPIKNKTEWWQAFFSLGLWTAFRLNDLLRIKWTDIQGDWLVFTPQKTCSHGLVQEIPMHPAVSEIIRRLPEESPYILRGTKSLKQLRRELERICVTAGVKYFTPHDIRRAGITMWSIAHPEAGRIIHGCGKRDVMQHYLSPRKILESAAPRVRLPQEMLPEDKRSESEQQEQEMLLRFKNAAPEQRELLIKLSRQLG